MLCRGCQTEKLLSLFCSSWNQRNCFTSYSICIKFCLSDVACITHTRQCLHVEVSHKILSSWCVISSLLLQLFPFILSTKLICMFSKISIILILNFFNSIYRRAIRKCHFDWYRRFTAHLAKNL